MIKKIGKLSIYLIAPLVSLVLVVGSLGLWNKDLSLPFCYEGDCSAVLFVVKTIISEGWFFTNSQVGLPHFGEVFNLHDYPSGADSFHFFLIKILSFFSQNPFQVVNWFFLLTFSLVAFTAFIALRSFGISVFTAVLIAVLFSLTPYHFYRNVGHFFLSNYMIVPLIIMMAMWLIEDRVSFIGLSEKQKFHIAPNRRFLICVALCFLIASNGIYYAFYGCVIFLFCWILRGVRSGSFFTKESWSCLLLIGLISSIVLALNIPSIFYWIKNGDNPFVFGRVAFESDLYGLRISSLLLPIHNHYLQVFADFTEFFYKKINWANGEHASESLGLLASCGFIFLLFYMLGKNGNDVTNRFSFNKSEKVLLENMTNLNFMTIIFLTVGSFIILFALWFPYIRSHARFSIFIAFFSLTTIAIIMDKIIKDSSAAKRKFIYLAVVAASLLAMLDQVGRHNKQSSEKMMNNFFSDKIFIEKIETSMPPQSQIFILPVFGFPEVFGDNYASIICYLHSKNLRWSYPVINGRKSHIWQEKIIKMDFHDFISELKKAGFAGIYIDRERFKPKEKNDWDSLKKLEKKLERVQKNPPLISGNGAQIFYRI